MGGCSSQQSIDSEAMLAEHESCSVVERAAGDEVVVKIQDQAPVQGGSSEYAGAYVENGMAYQNTVEPTMPVSNDQTEQPVLRVSPNVHQNSSEPMFNVPIDNMVKASVDEPVLYQTFEEQPMVDETDHQIFEEQLVTLPVPDQFEEIFPLVSSDVHFVYQNSNDAVFDVPTESTVKTIVVEPLSQPFDDPVVERTLHNQILEEQPVIEQVESQTFEVQPVSHIFFGDRAVMPTLSSETHKSVEVNEKIDVVETQPAGHDLGVVFEGRTFRTRVFDPNLKEYVYVGGDYVEPRGGLVM